MSDIKELSIPELKELTPAQLSQAKKRFDWLLSFLICHYKFVHQILGMMTKYVDYKVETMAVSVTADGKFQMYWSPSFFETLKDEEATYVHYHEVMHIVLHHCTKRKGDKLNHELWNIAHDLAVNELILDNAFCKIPRTKEGKLIGCHVRVLKEMPEYTDIKERQTAEWYFQYLREKNKKNQNGSVGDLVAMGSMDSHDGWGKNEIADERIRAKIKEIELSETWGSLPQTDIETIKAAQIKKISWEALMLTWFGNYATKERVTTRKRPNRRTGYAHPGYRKGYTEKWLVVADTSGSTMGYLKIWGAVINQIAEELPIDFAQCDCNVTCEPVPFENAQIDFEFKGMGGTDFQPIIDLVDKNNYAGLCILTDGEAAACTKPKSAQVLWCLPIGKVPPVEWGTRIHLEESI